MKIFNCGVSGGTATNALLHMHSQCLVYNPTHVVIMFGVNDIARTNYAPSVRDNEENITRRLNAMANCKASYAKVIDNVIAAGASPVLCTPVPYDEVSDSPAENLECQCALDEVADYVRTIASERGYPLIDFTAQMKPLLGKRAIISPDRVHPTPHGYHVMAQIFLHDIGAIDECDFDTPFVFEEWNEKRYEAERKLHCLKFVEFDYILHSGFAIGATLEEKKAVARAKYDSRADKSDFISRALLEYIDNFDNYTAYVGDVVRLTTFE